MFAIALGIVPACSGGPRKLAPPPLVASSPPDAAPAPADAGDGDGEQSVSAAMEVLCESTWDGVAEEYATRTWIPYDLASQITNDAVNELIGSIATADRKAPVLRDFLADNALVGFDCPLEYRLESRDDLNDPGD
jgi:hypothetical protein